MKSSAATALGLVLVAACASSCAALRPARKPMPSISYPAKSTPQSCLLVLLPGRHSRVDDFARHGFIEDIRRAGVPADVVVADAHLGYYRTTTILQRLREDIIQPARAAGYTSIWLVGVSMGGTGAVLYDYEHPGEVNGILLIAPYLGDRPIVEEVARAGGARSWRASGRTGKEFERMVWRWVKRRGNAGAGAPPVLLGFGSSDAFARANRLLADVLLPEHVFVVPGGHRWAPWRVVWRRFLASKALAPR